MGYRFASSSAQNNQNFSACPRRDGVHSKPRVAASDTWSNPFLSILRREAAAEQLEKGGLR